MKQFIINFFRELIVVLILFATTLLCFFLDDPRFICILFGTGCAAIIFFIWIYEPVELAEIVINESFPSNIIDKENLMRLHNINMPKREVNNVNTKKRSIPFKK